MTRLPQPGKDAGQWGDILNDFLTQSHNADGTLKDNVVGTSQLQDNSVGSAQLQDNAVGASQLRPGSVDETTLSSTVQTKLNQTAPVTKVNNQTGDITLTKTDIGLNNVDNTADSAKPISTTQQAALDLKADTTALAAKLNTADLDAQTAAKITTDGTATQAALSAAFVRGESRDAGGTTTTGDVILIGDYAYAPAGIATAAVLGGAPLYENVIGGNPTNVNTTTSNLTGAAALTGTDGNWNFIHGGYDNVVNGWACSVMGYHCKAIAGANHVTISGGSLHTANATAAYSTIAGGTQNIVAQQLSTVSGGSFNEATGAKGTVGGGTGNKATADSSSVLGGASNLASGANASVIGGNTNTASGNSSVVGGGLTNTASATGAVVVGGRDNTASGPYSQASGRGAVATEYGQQAYAHEGFAVPGDAQINRWALKKQTTDATAANLECVAGTPPVIPVDTTWAFSALIVARRTDVDGDNAAYRVEGCFKRDAGNTAALVGTPTVTALGASAGAATWTVTVNSFSVGTLRLIVTGEAAKTIRWMARLEASSVSG